ncbi:MAG TPA: DoxX family protein [Terracidiphilus sp.]|nr:DoxX family protein [Terracidiphilus sp.]
MNELFTHNAMLWGAQIALSCIFFYAAFTKVFARSAQANGGGHVLLFACDGMPCRLIQFIALLEFVCALCLIVPIDIWPAHLLPRIASAVLASLVLITVAHHVRHKQHTAPIIGVFFLTLFVLVGRWPW